MERSGAYESVAHGCPLAQRLEKRLANPRLNPDDTPYLDEVCRCKASATDVVLGTSIVTGNTAHVQATLTWRHDPPQYFRFTLLRQNGGWLVDGVTCSDGSRVYQDTACCRV